MNARSVATSVVMIFSFSFPLAAHSQSTPTALPAAPERSIHSLTPEPGYFTEPGIAVNPQNPEQVVAVFQDNVHASYSDDAGQTWHAAEGVAPKNYRVSGDVSTVFDNQGHA